jgi:hypothetical protein
MSNKYVAKNVEILLYYFHVCTRHPSPPHGSCSPRHGLCHITTFEASPFFFTILYLLATWIFVIWLIPINLAAIILFVVPALPLSLRLPILECCKFKNIRDALVHISSVMWITSIPIVFGFTFLINRQPSMLTILFHISI